MSKTNPTPTQQGETLLPCPNPECRSKKAVAPSDSARRAAEEWFALERQQMYKIFNIDHPAQIPPYLQRQREKYVAELAAIISKHFAATPTADDTEPVPTVALHGAIVTCKSGGGSPLVLLSFDRLEDAQAVHRWLVTLKSQPDTPTKGDR